MFRREASLFIACSGEYIAERKAVRGASALPGSEAEALRKVPSGINGCKGVQRQPGARCFQRRRSPEFDRPHLLCHSEERKGAGLSSGMQNLTGSV